MRRAPRVRSGDAITAARWNGLVDTVNGRIRAPLDKESAGALPAAVVLEGATTDLFAKEQARDSITVRITNPTDDEQFVDVSRAAASVLTVSDGRRIGVEWLG